MTTSPLRDTFAHRLLKAIANLTVAPYLVVMLGWLVLRTTVGERMPLVPYLNMSAPLSFAPLLLLIPLALMVRLRWAVAGLLIVAVAFVALFWRDLMPMRRPAAATEGPHLRVLTYNALYRNDDFDGVLRMIEESRADILVVQELTPPLEAHLTETLAQSHPYVMAHASPSVTGNGIWSRYPFVSQEAFDLSDWAQWAQAVSVEVEGIPVRVVNVHTLPLTYPDPNDFKIILARQNDQARTVASWMAADESAVIAAGDFNATPLNETYRVMAAQSRDVWREAGSGLGLTYPSPVLSPLRLLRIDYQWVRGPIIPLSIQLLDPAGSDHIPIVAEYVLTAP